MLEWEVEMDVRRKTLASTLERREEGGRKGVSVCPGDYLTLPYKIELALEALWKIR